MAAPAEFTQSSIHEIRFLGLPTWIKADRKLTNGQFSLVEQAVPVGFESPWHIHHSEDETFYVLEGQMMVIVDGRASLLKAGDVGFGPRGVPHGFRTVGGQPTRVLLMTTGSDFADFVAETSVSTDTPPAAPDMGALVAAAQRNRITILGPLPQ